MSFNAVYENIKFGTEVLEILKDAKKVLLGNKPEAERQLAETIGEIQKFYEAFSKEISSFQSISFEDGKDHTLQREKLSDIRNGGMSPRISEARGHCYKIAQIYNNHLSTWFNEVFLSESIQYDSLKNLFEKPTGFDEGIFRANDELRRKL